MDNVTYRLMESAVATLRQIGDALDRQVEEQVKANGMAERLLMNQEKSLANMDQLKKSSQALELNLMEGKGDAN